MLNGSPPEPQESSEPAQSQREHNDKGEEPGEQNSAASVTSADASSRLDSLQEERDNLRAEVTSLRQSLEALQERHNSDDTTLREELEQSRQSKENAETNYRNLLGKVNTIRSQLGERLKADAEELEQARAKIEELERTQDTAKEENERLQDQVSSLRTQLESQTSEVDDLRSRSSLSTSNWAKERDDMISKEAYVREEYEVAKQAMQDWEVLATEERARREALEERAQELEEQLVAQREAHERATGEIETQNSTVDGLQRALQDLQEERKRELRDIVEQSQIQLEDLRGQAKASEDIKASLEQQLSETQTALERAAPFEKEVKEKNLLIGKLRHEAVILNDHLTKALRFLKRGKPEDNVDRQLVTNHFLHFLALDRSDAKKFQILQLIAALLGWTEEQKEQAGLLRQGSLMTSSGSLRVPLSPFRRTPSTPSLSPTDFGTESAITGKESLAELWSEFLEREAEAGSTSGGGSRRGSVRENVRSPSATSVTSPILAAPGGGRQLPEAWKKEIHNAGGGAGGET